MDTTILERAFSPAAFRQFGHDLIDQLADHLTDAHTRQDPAVIPWQTPDDALAHWRADFDQPALTDPAPLFADIVARSVRLQHPRYMGHQVSAVAPVAALAGLLSALLNNGMAVYEMGMVANPMERILCEHLAHKIGFGADAGGLITSGGTLANLTALLTARACVAPGEVWQTGTRERLAVIVSEDAHYCVERAARIMGLGEAGIIKIPVDARHKLRTDLLETRLRQARADGLTVFAIVGSACSTATGSHDDLTAIADFAERHRLWFHVDAAHGGGAVFSPRYRHLLAGSDRADSVVIDYHKMLLVPGLATALIYHRQADSYRTFHQQADYLFTTADEDWYNSGKRTFECTKSMICVKVYTLLRLYGESLFTANVETLYDLGRTFAALVLARPAFALALAPECNIVCFRYVGHDRHAPMEADALDALNGQIRADLLADGGFYIVQTRLENALWLRVSLMNPLTTEADLTALLDRIETLARPLLPAHHRAAIGEARPRVVN
jgi:L-2,4-diaminobutyrate decarboxylase